MLLEPVRNEEQSLPAHVAVAVVGSGFAGIGTAIRLRHAGIDLVVLERAADLGGTWRDNSYPDCACDVPSHLYSFSFAPNPNWTRTFSPQDEIWDYLRDTVRRFGVAPSIRYQAEVTHASWDEQRTRWTVETTRGRLTANVLVLATGGLSEPSVPSFPGLERFEGTAFHSAQWRHDHDLAGERVAVVGTGASGIQFVPTLQHDAASLSVFQRTPPWILPRRDRGITALERWLFRTLPASQRTVRASIYAARESWVLGFAVRPQVMAFAEKQARRFLRREVPDPELRAKLTPTYRLGCKRVLLSSDYYRALVQPNVELVTDHISEILPSAIATVSPDGVRAEHPVDTIIFATGFRVTDPPIARRILGRDGRTLAERWSENGMSALRGTTVAGFPNLFFLSGPNTGLGHTSVILMIEAQIDYLMQSLKGMRAHRIAAIEPTRVAQDAYNDRVQRMLGGTVWNSGGCRSWYLDARGRNTTLWPTFTFSFMRELARFDPSEYRLARERPAPAATRRPSPERTLRVRSRDGAELHARVIGPEDAPTVVLAHGWTCSSDFWCRQIESLSAELRLVVFDQRGHGASAVDASTSFSVEHLADDLDGVIEACVPPGRRALLVGHSMGAMGIVAWAGRFSHRVPERVAAALLASTGIADGVSEACILPLSPRWRRTKALTGRLFLRAPVPLGGPSPLVQRAVRYVALSASAPQEDVALCTRMMLRCAPRVRAGWGKVLYDVDLRHAVSALTVPTSVLVGTEDRLTPAVLSRRLAGALPQLTRLVEIPSAGHMTPIEAAAAVNEEIRWLARLAVASDGSMHVDA